MAIPTPKFNKAQVEEASRMLASVADGFERASATAINASMRGTRTDGVKILTAAYSFYAAPLRKRFVIAKYASKTSPSGKLRISGKPINLTDLKGTVQDEKGVIVNVKKSTGPRNLTGFFIKSARNSGKELVLGRPTNPATGRRYPRYGPPGSGGGGKTGNRKRSTLFVRYAPHPEVVINTKDNWGKLAKKTAGRMDKELGRAVDKILKGFIR